jgi:hypothetical protein
VKKVASLALSATCFTMVFLLDLFFDPEDGGDIFFRNIDGFQRTTRFYAPEDRTLHNYSCENLKFYTIFISHFFNFTVVSFLC